MNEQNEEARNRIALVTGGNSAIGCAIAKRLSTDGIRVFLACHRHTEAASAVTSEILQEGGSAEILIVDINDSTGVDAACQSIYERCNSLDILVNCAALNIESSALGMADDDWEKVIATNLSGAFRLCRAAAKYMLLGRWGRIINISSIAGSFGGRGQINYAASKAAIESMTRVLALELGRKGVVANCIAPGTIESGMSGRIRTQYGAELLDSIAVRRFGKPDDVAGAVGFLVSEAAGYITGQVIRVDGGMHL